MQSTRYSFRILTKLEFARQIFQKRKAQISSFIETRPVGGKLFHAHGRKDMTKLIVAFRNFANAPTSSSLHTFLPHQTNCDEDRKDFRYFRRA